MNDTNPIVELLWIPNTKDIPPVLQRTQPNSGYNPFTTPDLQSDHPLDSQTPGYSYRASSKSQVPSFRIDVPGDLPFTIPPQEAYNPGASQSFVIPSVTSAQHNLLFHYNPEELCGNNAQNNTLSFLPSGHYPDELETCISQSTDPEEIERLKRQERKIRNWKSAKESRKWKREHTEQLEQAIQRSTNLILKMQKVIANLEGNLDHLQTQIDSLGIKVERIVQMD